MATVTVYYVQPFWRAGPTKLARGDLRQYEVQRQALSAGEAAARRQGGALVFSMRGNPEFEFWEKPRLVKAIGEVPEVEF